MRHIKKTLWNLAHGKFKSLGQRNWSFKEIKETDIDVCIFIELHWQKEVGNEKIGDYSEYILIVESAREHRLKDEFL